MRRNGQETGPVRWNTATDAAYGNQRLERNVWYTETWDQTGDCRVHEEEDLVAN